VMLIHESLSIWRTLSNPILLIPLKNWTTFCLQISFSLAKPLTMLCSSDSTFYLNPPPRKISSTPVVHSSLVRNNTSLKCIHNFLCFYPIFLTVFWVKNTDPNKSLLLPSLCSLL
jgi:hypothetical protein